MFHAKLSPCNPESHQVVRDQERCLKGFLELKHLKIVIKMIYLV